MNGFYKLVVAKLKEAGWVLIRQPSGSHQTWEKNKSCVTVSTNCYSRHTANQIMKDAGIDHKF